MARLLADGVTHMLDSKPQRPVCFVNIAGGPAPDSWNALILLLKSERPELMASRDVVIAVLDLDETGPAFGGRAVAALRTPGAPLHGLEVAVRHIPFAWSDTDRLGQVLEELRARETACAISSEGAGYLNMGRMLRSLQTFICCTPEREPMPLSPDQ